MMKAPPDGLARRWPWVVAAAGAGVILVALGVDIGLRIAERRSRSSDGVAQKEDSGSGLSPEERKVWRTHPPDPIRDAVEAKQKDWAPPPPAPLTYEPEAPMPPPVDALLRRADEARAAHDLPRALELFAEAEAAVSDERQRESLRIRRLWVLYEAGRFDEVRRLATELGAHASRPDIQKMAAEVLVKLDKKAR
jgi:hypothetical protein